MRTWNLWLVLLAAACGGGGEATPADAGAPAVDAVPPDAAPVDGGAACRGPALQASLDGMRAQLGPAGMSAAVFRPGICLWTGATGLADVPAQTPVVPGDRFRIGSITKTFTAAIVLQLVDEGLVHLDDTLDEWVAGVPNGATITVEHLLRHVSGIYNYTDAEFFGRATEPWTPTLIVEYAAARSPVFAPGTAWEYSNTNFILLGMIVELATSSTYGDELRARLLDPRGLDDTFLEGDEPIPGDFVRGYVHSEDTYVDVRDGINPDAAWAAGAVVSNARDVAAWGAALLGGDVIPAALLAQMTTPVTLPDGSMVGYGMGMGMGDTPWGPVQGHGGAIHGFRASLLWFPDDDAGFATLVNDGDVDADSVQFALIPVVLGE